MKICEEHKIYPSWSWIECGDFYKDPDEKYGEWLKCPKCNLTPKVWIFDNGRYTACGCWENRYKHWSIVAESICSIYSRDGHSLNYHQDQLRINWNHYCETGEVLFKKPNDEGRW